MQLKTRNSVYHDIRTTTAIGWVLVSIGIHTESLFRRIYCFVYSFLFSNDIFLLRENKQLPSGKLETFLNVVTNSLFHKALCMRSRMLPFPFLIPAVSRNRGLWDLHILVCHWRSQWRALGTPSLIQFL